MLCVELSQRYQIHSAKTHQHGWSTVKEWAATAKVPLCLLPGISFGLTSLDLASLITLRNFYSSSQGFRNQFSI